MAANLAKCALVGQKWLLRCLQGKVKTNDEVNMNPINAAH